MLWAVVAHNTTPTFSTLDPGGFDRGCGTIMEIAQSRPLIVYRVRISERGVGSLRTLASPHPKKSHSFIFSFSLIIRIFHLMLVFFYCILFINFSCLSHHDPNAKKSLPW